MKRRNFLAETGLAAVALAGSGIQALAGNAQAQKKAYSNTTTMENKRAKIAIITWTFGIDDLDQLFSKVTSTGFDAVQFCSDVHQYAPAAVVRYAEKYGVRVLSYDPGACKPPAGQQATIENAVEYFTATIEFAKAIGAEMSCLQGLSNWTTETQGYEEAMRFIIEVTRRLDKVAQQHEMTLTYEACCHYELPWVQTADELLRIHRESQAKNLLLVLDSFHMNIAETDMLAPIRRIGKLLHSYHVSDSGRGGIGTGHIDYVAQYKALQETGFDGYVFFEFVIPEVRPYKFPMDEKQMEEFVRQCKYSLNMWKAIVES